MTADSGGTSEAGREPGKLRPWWQKKRWMALLFLIAWFAASAVLPRFPVGPFTQYADLTETERAARIPYVTLSSEQTHPFRAWAYRHAGYDRAVLRFPDARSCLVRSERAKPDPDIRLIDWYAISGSGLPWDDPRVAAEVCLFRLFAGMTPDTVGYWLQFQGLSTSPLVEKKEIQPRTGIYFAQSGGFETKDRYTNLHRNIVAFYANTILYHSESIGISWNIDLSLRHVSYSRVAL